MTTHTCPPGHVGILADGCDRCAELSTSPLSLDPAKTEALWNRMIDVEHGDAGYHTSAEAVACGELHRIGMWLERLGGHPWVPFGLLKQRIERGLS